MVPVSQDNTAGSWGGDHHSERQTFNSQDPLPEYSYHLESLHLVSPTRRSLSWGPGIRSQSLLRAVPDYLYIGRRHGDWDPEA